MSIEELEANGATTGLVLEYRKGAQPPAKILPNQVPSGLDRITYKAEEHIKSISNVTDSMQGADREDVAAKAIAYKAAALQRHAQQGARQPRADGLPLARNVIDIVQDYHTEERLITITHEDFTQQEESITESDGHGDAASPTTSPSAGSRHRRHVQPDPPSLEDSQFEQARALRSSASDSGQRAHREQPHAPSLGDPEA
ncbi:MAG: hypothetical protein IPN20_04485, partial [Haliscomenobacter sp.]|nr:hypothetical protein [Haliscomenobacter sp.]